MTIPCLEPAARDLDQPGQTSSRYNLPVSCAAITPSLRANRSVLRPAGIMLTVAAMLLAVPALAQTKSASSQGLSQSDRQYLQQDARGAAYELQISQLAAQRSQNPQVRQYAEMVVNDHTQANQELHDVAQQNGLTLPTSPNHRQRQQMASLQKLNGAAFDKAYILDVKRANQRDIKEEQQEASTTKNPQIKDYVQHQTQLDQKHAQMAGVLGSGRAISGNSASAAGGDAAQQMPPNGQSEPNR